MAAVGEKLLKKKYSTNKLQHYWAPASGSSSSTRWQRRAANPQRRFCPTGVLEGLVNGAIQHNAIKSAGWVDTANSYGKL